MKLKMRGPVNQWIIQPGGRMALVDGLDKLVAYKKNPDVMDCEVYPGQIEWDWVRKDFRENA